MPDTTIHADYLVKGAGAVGMAFVDSLLADTDATVVIVDRRDRPGGHWNDAYPFVRLHQPSSSYGVSSAPLGSGEIDQVGLNRGFEELASGAEVVSHFDLVMRHRFLPSGRVRFLPTSDVDDDGVVTSLLSGGTTRVEADRFVDATWSRMEVPSCRPPAYTVDEGVACVPLNDLPRRAHDFERFVVIGAGKTGMDACNWLLEQGAEPDRIRWVMPRDSWVLDRGNVQPGEAFFARFCKSLADQVQAAAEAETVADVFTRLEECGELVRLDPEVEPGAYHCAILSEAEMAQLRRIRDVIRLGRVSAVERDTIHLDGGSVPTDGSTLHVDCSAAGIPALPATAVFAGDRITPQWVRTCQPTFSAAFVGHVEATVADEDEKNRICAPIAPPVVPLDWLRMMRQELTNRRTWMDHPHLGEFLASTRLDPFNGMAPRRLGVDAEATAHLGRYLDHVVAATDNLDRLLAGAGTGDGAGRDSTGPRPV